MKNALKAAIVGILIAGSALAIGGPNVYHFLAHFWGGIALGKTGDQLNFSGAVSEIYNPATFTDAGYCLTGQMGRTIQGAQVTDTCVGTITTDAGAAVEPTLTGPPRFQVAYNDGGYGYIDVTMCDLQIKGAAVIDPPAFPTYVRCFSTEPH